MPNNVDNLCQTILKVTSIGLGVRAVYRIGGANEERIYLSAGAPDWKPLGDSSSQTVYAGRLPLRVLRAQLAAGKEQWTVEIAIPYAEVASFLDSEEWYSERLAICRARRSAAEDAAAKPSGDLTADELNYWLREFGGTAGPNKVESDSPFPPGYADDLRDDG